MVERQIGCRNGELKIWAVMLLLALSLGNVWGDSALAKSLISTRLLSEQSYNSHLSAAIDLRERFLTDSVLRDREHVGAILKDQDGRFWATHGVGGVSQDTVNFSIPKARSSEIVAYWHTHGRSGFARSMFSPHDVEIVKSQKVPLYLLAPNGDIKILRQDLLLKKQPARLSRRSALGVPKKAHKGLVVARRGEGL